MAFPASAQIQVDGLQQARRTALGLKNEMQVRNAVLAAQSVEAGYVLDILRRVVSAVAVFNEVKAISGIGDFAQAQYADMNLDIAAEFTAMVDAATAVGAWIIANLPSSGGYLQIQTMNANGTVTDRTFTSAQTAGLRTTIAALIATIG